MSDNKDDNNKRKLNVFRLILLITLLAALTFGGVAIGMVVASVKDLPDLSVEAIDYNASTLIFDQNEKLITKIGTQNRVLVDLQEVPEIVRKAFLATEDVRFYQHCGIDFRGIARAAWQNITSGSIQEGASTITQQVIRDLYLTQDRNFKRKIQEIILAIQLERKLSKDEILELYLNRIYFGEGAYGIQAAAETYFGKDINELGLKEGAFLAGLPQAPSAYSPYQNKDLALKRRNIVLGNMLKYNFINKNDYDEAVNKNLGTLDSPASEQYPYPYYIDYVTEQLVEKYGEEQVFKGGLRVYIAVDHKIQTIAEEVLANDQNLPTKDIQGAVVILDPHTGYIKALVGGREHTQKRQLNRATQIYRQPGSTFKPIIAYAPAIEFKGMGPASVIDDIPINIEGWSPNNSDGSYRGLITMRTALTNSVNIAAVKLLQQVTAPEAKKFARKLGITSLDPKHDVGLSMALGGLYKGVTPLELAGAYGAFANQGIYIKPTAIIRVEKFDKTVLEDTSHPKQQIAMKPTTAYLMTDMMQSVINYGTGKKARLDRPVAGKTGTTDKNIDTWFAGYTPELVGIVWVGYDTNKQTYHYGGDYPAIIWRKIMSKALEDVPRKDFPSKPNGITTATVDSKSGLLPGPNTPPDHLVTDKFVTGTVPNKHDNTHVLVEVCATSGKLVNNYCPDRITKIMLKLPYTVPYYVKDYEQRVPTSICNLHGPGTSSENGYNQNNGKLHNLDKLQDLFDKIKKNKKED
ncbi:transglycosylase domain-containing protein [Desulfolucanica intricata]|uniref:transglycosylase domain-containing protein n=1 Tax=Desulfolucanica intricata TaxID=1285191 RepID=UPI0009ECE3D7|nr:penicillin-binding protein 1A [Desulfolucanica intricata]